ncbi:CHAD domain-containing protein [Kushneria indalinina]|uniref:CHAD domain-containing protein n=1 Tax=Kushneria indalinina DSM 14324 TaxID=1122140 RepID=A0A3D9DVK6_9GAMM|nr:CHAD domain-containing protein [Kushneria indalinina]REC94810.1 CHAD domain-containing protein [Kushneria indalinina DSM 14324]
MAYRLEMSESTSKGLARIAAEQIDRARRDIARRDTVEGIHKLRQRCKRVRAVLRLGRPALGKHYARENRRFRDLARAVGGPRDEQILIDTLDALMAVNKDRVDRRQFTPTRQQLLKRHRQALKATALPDRAWLSSELEKAREAVNDWAPAIDRFKALSEGLTDTSRRARQAMKQAEGASDEVTFHEWRKQVKYHRHHCELLANVWKAPMDARAKEAHRLADLLGEEHDLAMLAQVLSDPATAFQGQEKAGALLEMIAERRQTLQGEALLLGRRLFAEKPEALGKRIKCYQAVARQEAREAEPSVS